MHTLVLSTLLFNGLATVAIVLGMALSDCTTRRRRPHDWVAAGLAVRPGAQSMAVPHAPAGTPQAA